MSLLRVGLFGVSFSLALFFSLLWAIFSDHVLGIISVSLLALSMVVRVGGDLTHPSTWAPPFIVLYNISILILDVSGVRVVYHHNELLLISWLALSGFFIGTLPAGSKSLRNALPNTRLSVSLVALLPLVGILTLCSILVVLAFFMSGANQKSEFDGGFTSLFRVLLYCLVVWVLYGFYIRSSATNRILILYLFLFLFSALALGERDVFFSYALAVIFLLYVSGRGGRLLFYSIGFVLLMLIPILGEYKNLFTKSEFNSIDFGNYFMVFLDGEFRSAGFNNEVILNSFQGPFFFGRSLVNDVLRALVPGFILSFENSVAWYNNTFHPNIRAIGQGYGFSLAAEGYINFSYFGVLLWFAFYGLIVSFFYRMAFKSVYYLAAYICSVPVFIYSLRGDFSTLLSPIIKTIFFTYMVLVFIDLALRGVKRGRVVRG